MSEFVKSLCCVKDDGASRHLFEKKTIQILLNWFGCLDFF